MKLIIDIPEEQYNDIVKHLTDNDGNYAYSDFNLREIIRNGTPYNPTGDLISREDLKEVISKVVAEERKEDAIWAAGLRYALTLIDNAPTVEPVIKCPDCKFYRKKWFVDRRMKEKGYWNCWCECHDYWVGGENGFCSLAEKKGGAE